MRLAFLFLTTLVALTRAQDDETFGDVSDDFYNSDPTVKQVELPTHRWLQVYLLDSFRQGKPKKDLVSKVRKQILGLGTYFHKIVGID